ncbi:MAG: PAS domain S-box protein, partial [Dehalococcoidia bacterium]
VDRMKAGERFNGRLAQSGDPLLVADASEDPRLTRAVVRKERLQAQLIVPLISKGKVVGTLCAAMRRPRQFHSEEIELLTAIGNQIGVSIENAHLYEQERLIAEQLRVSEKNYRELFENASDAIWVHDPEGNILAVNKACEKLTGYSREELSSMKAFGMLSERGLDIVREMERKLLNGESLDHPFEVELINKGGAEAIIELQTTLVTTGGQPTGFQHTARDVTEQRRMQENLRFYVQQITRAQEEERKRIACELHDDTAQALVALSRQLDSFISSDEHLPMQQITFLEELRQQANSILEGVRRFSQDLRPSVLDDLGLLPALEWLTSELRTQYGVLAEIKVLGAPRRLPPEAELVLFRIAQEALRNVWKHAQASRAVVTVEFGDSKMGIEVSDDGKGFKVPPRVGDLTSEGKLGLVGMLERARLLGGSLVVQSDLGKGTTVAVEAPI